MPLNDHSPNALFLPNAYVQGRTTLAITRIPNDGTESTLSDGPILFSGFNLCDRIDRNTDGTYHLRLNALSAFITSDHSIVNNVPGLSLPCQGGNLDFQNRCI
jgi:hypothetical protein